ncbi:hypothetical protein VB618_01070 [Microvirga sp. CF3062]|uniref:hypothetical protein n=1 Tax=Microvirga sp. CF3062 TaxID=3110182 RepID=UPI002E7A31CE|nr:hypothetical protein [Microvirga sp. CF3062]MEE1654770.1 hypothetical protein [Microvirga sp. CF3062]
MRIGWASPFNERSAVARYSLWVCRELKRRGARVEIIRTETGAEETLPVLDSSLVAYPPRLFTTDFLASHFDLCVVNVARDASDHGRAEEIARRFQSVTIFHDLRGDRYEAEAALVDEAAVKPAEVGWMALPAAFATGAVVHDLQYLDGVRRLCAGPVAAISLELGDIYSDPADAGPDRGAARRLGPEGCVEKYVDDLLEVLDEALHRAPLRNAGWTIGATVAEMGLAWDDPLSSRLGNEMFALFEGNRRGLKSDKN